MSKAERERALKRSNARCLKELQQIAIHRCDHIVDADTWKKEKS